MGQYQINRLSWEMTLRCNMRCKHCGSSCAEASPDELTHSEAMDVVEQLIEMGVRRVDLLGGEPLLRPDWDEIAGTLSQQGIEVLMISNGSLIDRKMARRIADSGVALVSLSLEGPEKIHDAIRVPGAFRKCMEAYNYLKEAGVTISCNTTIMTNTLSGLPLLRDSLIEYGLSSWQIQPALPYGRMGTIREQILTPDQLQQLIDFVLETNEQGRLPTILSENLGYYSHKQQRAYQLAYGISDPVQWKGCHAGIDIMGLMSNGDVTGCVSIRDPAFIEGNVRQKSLREIWESPDSFRWRRQMQPEQLGGVCRDCRYAAYCMSGCTCTKLSICGDLYAEYPYCSYAIFLKEHLSATW